MGFLGRKVTKKVSHKKLINIMWMKSVDKMLISYIFI